MMFVIVWNDRLDENCGEEEIASVYFESSSFRSTFLLFTIVSLCLRVADVRGVSKMHTEVLFPSDPNVVQYCTENKANADQ